jgi:hypothetical protein
MMDRHHDPEGDTHNTLGLLALSVVTGLAYFGLIWLAAKLTGLA